jgi:hypothetical protein
VLRASVLAAVVAALIFSTTSFAASKTTLPSKRVTVVVLITDRGIKVSLFADAIGVNGEPEPNTSLAVTRVPRGGYLSFNVYNRGKKVHDFTIFGLKTPPIKPGGKAHLFSPANTRGAFAYRSTMDRGSAFRGLITVY